MSRPVHRAEKNRGTLRKSDPPPSKPEHCVNRSKANIPQILLILGKIKTLRICILRIFLRYWRSSRSDLTTFLCCRIKRDAPHVLCFPKNLVHFGTDYIIFRRTRGGQVTRTRFRMAACAPVHHSAPQGGIEGSRQKTVYHAIENSRPSSKCRHRPMCIYSF